MMDNIGTTASSSAPPQPQPPQSAAATTETPAETTTQTTTLLLLRIGVPLIGAQKMLRVNPATDTVWSLKQQLMAKLPVLADDILNFGFFYQPPGGTTGGSSAGASGAGGQPMPSHQDDAEGTFLNETKRISDYALVDQVPFRRERVGGGGR